jgi:hypothetical protein
VLDERVEEGVGRCSNLENVVQNWEVCLLLGPVHSPEGSQEGAEGRSRMRTMSRMEVSQTPEESGVGGTHHQPPECKPPHVLNMVTFPSSNLSLEPETVADTSCILCPHR